MRPETLHQMAGRENELKDELFKAAFERDRFEEALAISNPSERAYAVSQFFKSQNPAAVFAASKEVVQIGPKALPALRAVLQNPDFLPNYGEIVLSMARVGRIDAGPWCGDFHHHVRLGRNGY